MKPRKQLRATKKETGNVIAAINTQPRRFDIVSSCYSRNRPSTGSGRRHHLPHLGKRGLWWRRRCRLRPASFSGLVSLCGSQSGGRRGPGNHHLAEDLFGLGSPFRVEFHRVADLDHTRQLANIAIAEPDAAVRRIVADRAGVAGAVDAISFEIQAEPVRAERIGRSRGTTLPFVYQVGSVMLLTI